MTARGVTEAIVCAGAVPGTEGRAGMAAIAIDASFDLGHFHDQICAQLPDYARPLFLRIRDEVETTGTFKPKKADLVNAGFYPAVRADQLYFRDAAFGRLIVLDLPLYNKLLVGEVRL